MPKNKVPGTSSSYENDEFVQIKPYKGRRKFELYLHNDALRTTLTAAEPAFALPAEGFLETKPFHKKLIFKDEAYGSFVQAALAFVAQGLRRKKDLASLQQAIAQLVSDLSAEFRLGDEAVREAPDFPQRLQKAYARATQLLKALES